jgi:hypothetical protein
MRYTGPSAGALIDTRAPHPQLMAAPLDQTRVRLRSAPQVDVVLVGGAGAREPSPPKGDVAPMIITCADKELAC